MDTGKRMLSGVRMEDIPPRERPYERFDTIGAEALTDTELLAVLIKNGTRGSSALSLASQILALDPAGSGPAFLCNIPIDDLLSVEGIGKVKAAVIKCAVELGRRAARNVIVPGNTVISSPTDVAEYLGEEMQHLQREELRVILLDTRNKVLRVVKIATGSVRKTLFSPKEIFKDAMKYNAAGIILVHNHPSGNPEPSSADIDTTNDLEKIGQDLDIRLVDHIILSKCGFQSIKSL